MNTNSVVFSPNTSDYAFVADTPSLSITGDLTLQIWSKLKSQPAADSSFGFISKYKGATNQRSFYLAYQDVGGTKRIYMGINPNGDGAHGHAVGIDQTLSNDVWYNVSSVYTAASHTAKILLNGVSIGSGDIVDTSIFDSTAEFDIGRVDTTGNADAKFNEARVWNSALTDVQILGNIRRQLLGNESGLVGYWKFNKNYNDSTANANNLTASGSPTFDSDVPFSGGGASFLFNMV